MRPPKMLSVVLLALALVLAPNLSLAQARPDISVWCKGQSVGFTGLGAAASKLVTGVAGQRVYVCGLIASAGAAAGTISLIEGTGTNCGTGTLAVLGTSAGSILLPIASQPMVLAALYPLVQTQGPGNDLCIISSTAGPVSGALIFGISQ